MLLPTQAQVATGVRYAVTITGTAIAIFGLQAKGISPDQVKEVISDAGTVVSDIVVMIGAIMPLWAAIRGITSSSPTAQAAAIGANPSTVVQPAPGGKATVTIMNPDMASAALDAQKKSA